MDPPDVRDFWAERRGAYSPDYYAHQGPDDASEALADALTAVASLDDPVLELGCGPGRHLAHLREQGFEDLHGVDVNGTAFDVMAEEYPDLAAAGTFYEGAIEDVVPDFDDDRFAAVYSVEVLQHVHPEAEWVFDEVERVTDDCLVTVENEGPLGDGDAPAEDERSPSDDGEETLAADGSDTEAAEGDETPSSDEEGPPVNYVAGEVPLYYRNWRSVFGGAAFEQVDRRETRRDTMRVFRAD